MKFALFLLFSPLTPWMAAVATLDVSSSIPAETFLVYETVPLQLRITNRGPDPVQFGGEETDGMIRLKVTDLRGRIIPRTDKPLLAEPWVILPGETSEHEFNLARLFSIRKAESYRCVPAVVLPDLATYEGKPVMFELRRGTEFGEVKRRRTDRVFTLVGVNRNRRDELLLQVSNYGQTMQLATYFLERHLRLYPPHILMNNAGEVGTLHYASPYQLVLCHFKADGTPVNRRFYKAMPGVPVRLHENPEGGFRVEGATALDPPASGAGDEDE